MDFLSRGQISQIAPQIPENAMIVGIDEAGRGPLAGPVVACALALPQKTTIKGAKDSKQLTAQKREELNDILRKKATFGIGTAEAKEVDKLGILRATNLAFERAIEQFIKNAKNTGTTINEKSIFLLIDGRDRLSLKYPFKTIIKGDSKIKEIACASIIAKVERDNIMGKYAFKYPQYGFEVNKGYGTADHISAIQKQGVCPEHRKTYEPVYTMLNQPSLFA